MAASQIRILTLLLAILCSIELAAQNVIKQKVDYQVSDQRLEDVLLEIADIGGFSFSYNPDLLPVDSLVTLNVENSTLEQVLKVLLGDELELRVSGNHLVILKTKFTQPGSGGGSSGRKTYTIDGYVTNLSTGEYLASATVFDVNRLNSTTSDSTGYFSLELPIKDEVIGIAVIKPDFEDTTVVMINGNQDLQLSLKPLPGGNVSGAAGSGDGSGGTGIGGVNNLKIVKLVSSDNTLSRTGQLEIYSYRFAQVSFLPFLGTNMFMSGNVENRYSLNILAGYNGATRGAEFGGLVNINKTYVRGVQFAGLGNVAGTETEGVQFAGIFNTNLGTVRGVQFSGINNLVIDSLKGVQISGINNIVTLEMEGVQFAGISNVALKDVDGVQLAGITNIAMRDVNKVQAAGILNFGRNIGGAQLAGILNTSYGEVDGLQLAGILNTGRSVQKGQAAGLMNVAVDSVGGVQLAALINFARKNKGFQLAILNINDTVPGVSIGLINLTWRGYNKLEVLYNEVLPMSARAKLGNRKFYNIFGFGTQGFETGNVWGYTYGMGGVLGVGKKHNDLDIELTATDLQNDDTWIDRFNINARMSVHYGYYLHKRFMVFAGPTWSNLIYDESHLQEDTWLLDIPPYTMYDTKRGKYVVQGWIGFEVGLRIW